MEITNIRIQKAENDNSRMVGYAEIVFDDCLKINGIRIIKGDNRIFAAMPNKKMQDGKYKDYVHPINEELRNKIDKAVEEAYIKSC